MAEPKIGVASNGEQMHYSVGAVIRKDDKYFLIDRATPPFGFAGIGGHIDEGEEDIEAAMGREILEEAGLQMEKCTILYEEEVLGNTCRRGIRNHYWYLCECEVSGDTEISVREVKSAGWYTADEIKSLKLEPVWEYWFRKIGLLD